jgi:uncharacterized OB-fold protein
MNAPTRTAPVPTPDTRYFWERCRERQLVVQRCSDCGEHLFYPRSVCTQCRSRDIAWIAASGRGTISTFTIVRRAFAPGFAAKVPYVVALVRLEEGPQLMTNIVACDVDAVAIGMAVEVDFEPVDGEITLPVFRPAR